MQFGKPRCDTAPDLFYDCPYWIPPHTFTALSLPANLTYLRMQYCASDEACFHDAADYFYGTDVSFPASVDVARETGFCALDAHCPGSFCDHLRQPPLCAPKRADQFQGPLRDFKRPNWELLGTTEEEVQQLL